MLSISVDMEKFFHKISLLRTSVCQIFLRVYEFAARPVFEKPQNRAGEFFTSFSYQKNF
jgi:hypothetical protein